MMFILTLFSFTETVRGNELPSIEELIANDGEVQANPEAKKLFEQAIARYEENDIEGAIHDGKIALQKDQKVLLLDDHGLFDGIESFLLKEASDSPGNGTAFFNLAKFFAVRNKTDKVMKALEKVVSIEPDSDLGKLAAAMLKRAPGYNTSASKANTKAYEKEYAKLEAKNTELQKKSSEIDKKIQKTEYNIKMQAARSTAQDKQIAQLKEQNEQNYLYSTLFWANPTNAWALEHNYTLPRPGEIKQYPEYYKKKAAQSKAKTDYYKTFSPPSTNGPVNLPADSVRSYLGQ
jgi:hypothetical protein